MVVVGGGVVELACAWELHRNGAGVTVLERGPDPDGPLTTWAGLRPAMPDGLPLIGQLPGHHGVYVAAGHGMLGVTLAPATAALLAPLALYGRAAPEFAPFDPARRR